MVANVTCAYSTTLAALLAGHRDYQREAHDAAIGWAKRSLDPGLIVAATGAGKSHIVASIATHMHILTRRPVLCLQPSGELTKQNARKLAQAFLTAGVQVPPVSMYSASTGQKSLRHPIVYATPGTAKGGLRVLAQAGAIIIDEAHGVTPSIRDIVDRVREQNPRVRVLGLTATPYRTDTGYIYDVDADGVAVPAEMRRDPYFARLVYEIGARRLLDHPSGPYLTPPIVAATGADAYDIDGLVVRKKGFGVAFDAGAEAKVYAGQGRKTAAIVADVVERTRHLKCGLIFAASIEHAGEILASMPEGSARVISGKMSKGERESALAALHSGAIKWLINRDILTTGYDEPRIDHVVFMRHTESPGLVQQIIGRCLRLHPGKAEAYVYDYARNMEKHFPNGRDIFDPTIRHQPEAGEGTLIDITCPECAGAQKAKLNEEHFDGADYDASGFLVMLGRVVTDEAGNKIPVHHTRKCQCLILDRSTGRHSRCTYLFSGKPCQECGEVNDIAARWCASCDAELVDPNEKLVLASDAHVPAEAPRVTVYPANVRESLAHSAKGDLYRVFEVPKVGDFWIPDGELLTQRWRYEMHHRWHSRRPGDDAMQWRRKRGRDGTLSKFPELIRWGKAAVCIACRGEKETDHWTQKGLEKRVCVTCAGTGVVLA